MSDVTVSISLSKQEQGRLYMQHLAAKKTVKALLEQRNELLAVLQAFERISDIWLPPSVNEEHEGEMQALHQARNDMLAAIAKATA
ncbi:hypothetical protein [Pseudomonas fluorescens]